jgi:hypothetical protein
MGRGYVLALLGLVLWTGGCISIESFTVPAEAGATKPGEKTAEKEQKRPKTLLEWTVGKNGEKNSKENGKDEENGKGGKQIGNGKDTANDKTSDDKQGEKDKPNGNGEDKEEEKGEEPKRIDPDRPHLPEASTTVGLGRAVLEAGYTYNTSGGFFPVHSFPETLLRIGMFADWFELRVAQNLISQTSTDLSGARSTEIGAEDLQLGFKLALTEQAKCLPESALIVQMTVPSGTKRFTADRVLPGIHYDCSWEVIKDKLSVETVILADGAVDDHRHTYTFMGDGVTAAYDLTKKLEAFGELDSFYATGESAAPQHYFVAGLVYFLTRNCEIDARAGVGLNQHADGYLLGSGFALRY